ncbi:MAG: hypothetical protein RR969_03350 [Thermomonas sp.]|jgi:tetratricopeptide (TPR) repeat protein
MTLSARHPLTAGIAAVLALAVLAPVAHAQQQASSPTMREQRAKRMAELGKEKKDEGKQEEAKPAAYPNATRVSPEAKASGKMTKNLQALQALYEKPDMAGVIAKADEIAAMPAANAYEKSFAYSLAGNAAADLDDQNKAADYFQKAVDSNGLDNDSHFSTMYNLAVIRYGQDKFAEALVAMDRFLAETKSEKPEHQSFRAGILANLGRNDEAATIYKALIANNPTDKRILMNAVAALQNADKFDQANVLLEDAYKRGMLTESRELRALYIGYMNAARWDDTKRVIDDGVAKGILQSGPELARDYQVLAQNAYADDKIALALDLYAKAAPMAADGEAYLNLAKVLEYSGKKVEAKAAAQAALDKGVKKPDEAKGILSR